MRYLTLGAIALAATLGASGFARAADELSRQDADEEALTGSEMQIEPGTRALGYTTDPRWHGNPLANFPGTTRAPDPTLEPLTPDDYFLRQGDRGKGE